MNLFHGANLKLRIVKLLVQSNIAKKVVDSISKSVLSGFITTLLHKKEHQRLHRCKDFSASNKKTKSLASSDDHHPDHLFPDNKDRKETAHTSKMEIHGALESRERKILPTL